ncbi:hypothetical protein P8452_66416 [Trifolium repens]|nr:hypothetical protein P8452_66416 [Trifolium repens]
MLIRSLAPFQCERVIIHSHSISPESFRSHLPPPESDSPESNSTVGSDSLLLTNSFNPLTNTFQLHSLASNFRI